MSPEEKKDIMQRQSDGTPDPVFDDEEEKKSSNSFQMQFSNFANGVNREVRNFGSNAMRTMGQAKDEAVRRMQGGNGNGGRNRAVPLGPGGIPRPVMNPVFRPI